MSAPAPVQVPEAVPGSTRFFTLLYTPRARRAAVRTLLALGDEIGGGLGRQIDHGVAHIRLEWWRAEAQRFAAGEPAHPWLIAWQREDVPVPDLSPLVEAAAIDLASERLAASASRRLAQELFVLAAELLCAHTPQATLAGERKEQIAALGRTVDEFEHPSASHKPASPAPAASRPPTPLAPGLQHTLAPLLVWAALAARQARRRSRREPHAQHAAGKSPTIAGVVVDGLVDNVLAWRAARAARRGRFRLEDLQGMGP
ncbi:MAG: hypothetical protein ACRET0_10825 [Steroidobacteraceae bacterium]